jgi:hypothetical protein
VLFDSMRSEQVGLFVPVVYYVSWIFIGNWILLNLFLAILLEGFVSEDNVEEEDQDEVARQQAEKRRTQIQEEKVRRLKKMGMQGASDNVQRMNNNNAFQLEWLAQKNK